MQLLLKHGGVYADADIEPMVGVAELISLTPNQHIKDARSIANLTLLTSDSLLPGFVNPHFIVARAGDAMLNDTLHRMLYHMKKGKTSVTRYSQSAATTKYPWRRVLEVYNKWTVCYNMEGALRSRYNWTGGKGGKLAPGVQLFKEQKVRTTKVQCHPASGCVSNLTASMMTRRATVLAGPHTIPLSLTPNSLIRMRPSCRRSCSFLVYERSAKTSGP